MGTGREAGGTESKGVRTNREGGKLLFHLCALEPDLTKSSGSSTEYFYLRHFRSTI